MLSLFLFGFLFAFLGFTPPSVLNMTALKIRLDSNRNDFTKYSLGVSFIVFLQVYFSIYLTDYISKNPSFLSFLEKLGIVVLISLSVYFYQQNKKEKKEINNKQKAKNPFFTGIILSTLNMFAIPFFCGSVALLMGFNLLHSDVFSTLFFVVGAVLGTYFILFLYGKFAYKIQQKTGNMTRNINLILCCITAGFALFTLLKFVI